MKIHFKANTYLFVPSINIVIVCAILFIFLSGSGCSLKKNARPPFNIVSTTVSKQIEITGDDSFPKNVTDSFTLSDTEIISHIRYANLSGKHYLRWEWYAPDGTLFHSTKNHSIKTSPGAYVKQGTSWHKIPIKGATTHNCKGRWKVNILFDDQLVACDFFEIKTNMEAPGFGDYYALVIGNNRYMFLQNLNTAENDARKVGTLLTNLYGFKVTVLINAKREDIMLALNKLRRNLTRKDNLLIYYAGHGYLDEKGDAGYWLPINAKKDNEINWVPNTYIATVLKAILARHVLIVSDSCYSGKLSRGTTSTRIRLNKLNYYKHVSNKNSRCVLSSGGLEPVIDSGGKDGHSIFAAAFIDCLKNNTGIMDANTLFTKVRHSVMLDSTQIPEYSDLRNAGHEGGDFLFIRK